VVKLLEQRGAPCDINDMGHGLVVMAFPTEDPNDYVWLGALATLEEDGPWLSYNTPGECRYVGGFRYTGHYDEQHVSERIEVPVDGDTWDDVADALAACWRKARTAPTPNTV
jgi:hypothetical protein